MGFEFDEVKADKKEALLSKERLFYQTKDLKSKYFIINEGLTQNKRAQIMQKGILIFLMGFVLMAGCDKQFATQPVMGDNCEIIKTEIVIKIINEIPLFDLTIKDGIVYTGYDSLDMLNEKYLAKSMVLQFTNESKESVLYGYYYVKFQTIVNVNAAIIDYKRLSIIEKAGTSGTCSTPN